MYAYEHIMSIQDPPEILSIILFYDADFAGDIQSRRSTSDYILNWINSSNFALLSWGSKTQSVYHGLRLNIILANIGKY